MTRWEPEPYKVVMIQLDDTYDVDRRDDLDGFHEFVLGGNQEDELMVELDQRLYEALGAMRL